MHALGTGTASKGRKLCNASLFKFQGKNTVLAFSLSTYRSRFGLVVVVYLSILYPHLFTTACILGHRQVPIRQVRHYTSERHWLDRQIWLKHKSYLASHTDALVNPLIFRVSPFLTSSSP